MWILINNIPINTYSIKRISDITYFSKEKLIEFYSKISIDYDASVEEVEYYIFCITLNEKIINKRGRSTNNLCSKRYKTLEEAVQARDNLMKLINSATSNLPKIEI